MYFILNYILLFCFTVRKHIEVQNEPLIHSFVVCCIVSYIQSVCKRYLLEFLRFKIFTMIPTRKLRVLETLPL